MLNIYSPHFQRAAEAWQHNGKDQVKDCQAATAIRRVVAATQQNCWAMAVSIFYISKSERGRIWASLYFWGVSLPCNYHHVDAKERRERQLNLLNRWSRRVTWSPLHVTNLQNAARHRGLTCFNLSPSLRQWCTPKQYVLIQRVRPFWTEILLQLSPSRKLYFVVKHICNELG